LSLAASLAAASPGALGGAGLNAGVDVGLPTACAALTVAAFEDALNGCHAESLVRVRRNKRRRMEQAQERALRVA